MDSANGTQRDMIQQLLVWRDDSAAAEPLARLSERTALGPPPGYRHYARSTCLGKLSDEQIEKASAIRTRASEGKLCDWQSRGSNRPRSCSQRRSSWSTMPTPSSRCNSRAVLGETDDPRKIARARQANSKNMPRTPTLRPASCPRSRTMNSVRCLKRRVHQPKELPASLVNRLMELAGAASNARAPWQRRSTWHRTRLPTPNRISSWHLSRCWLACDATRTRRMSLTSDSAERLQQLSDQCLAVANDRTPSWHAGRLHSCRRAALRNRRRLERPIARRVLDCRP